MKAGSVPAVNAPDEDLVWPPRLAAWSLPASSSVVDTRAQSQRTRWMFAGPFTVTSSRSRSRPVTSPVRQAGRLLCPRVGGCDR